MDFSKLEGMYADLYYIITRPKSKTRIELFREWVIMNKGDEYE